MMCQLPLKHLRNCSSSQVCNGVYDKKNENGSLRMCSRGNSVSIIFQAKKQLKENTSFEIFVEIPSNINAYIS